MDDIQFWIYLIFAAIYFISRALRPKKQAEEPDDRPTSPLETQDDTTQRPATFEELLEEITGRRQAPKAEEQTETPFGKKQEIKPVSEATKKPQKVKPDFSKEGSERRFSDEESRRIYEESIKRAEGHEIAYQPDEKYMSTKVLRHTAEDVETNQVAEDIRNMLSNPEDAKKAIILSEILNRKY